MSHFPEIQTVLLVASDPIESSALALTPGRPRSLGLRPGGSDHFFALGYGATLAGLELPEGRLEPDTGGRGLPPPDAMLVADRRSPEFAPVDTLPPEIATHRFRWTSILERCAGRGECVDPVDLSACVVCETMVVMDAVEAAHPQIPPCPPGWIEKDFTPAFCDPWEGALDCDESSHQLPGAPACEPIGTDCPADGWPVPSDPAAVYVDSSSALGGDGSKLRPFRALEEIGAATVVHLRAGAHPGAIIDGERTIVGACLRDTTLAGATARGFATLRNLTIRGEVIVEARASLVEVAVISTATAVLVLGDADIERSLIAGGEVGLSVAGSATVNGTSIRDSTLGLSIHGTAALSGSRVSGTGTGAMVEGGDLSLDASVIAETGVALQVRDGAARISRSAILDSRGVVGRTGATLTVERTYFDRSREKGLRLEKNARATLTDVFVDRTSSETGARAITLSDSAQAMLERVTLQRSDQIGLRLDDAATASVTDLRVQELRQVILDPSRAIVLQSTSRLFGSRIFAAEYHEGLVVAGEATADVEDLVLVDSLAALPERGRGIEVVGAAVVKVRRAHIRANRAEGVSVVSGVLEMSDARLSSLGASQPVGFHVGATARLDLFRFDIQSQGQHGIVLAPGAAVSIGGGRIGDTPVGVSHLGNPLELRTEVRHVRFENVPLPFELGLPPSLADP